VEYKTVYPVEVLKHFDNGSMFVLMLYEPQSDKKVPVMIGEHEAEMIILEQSRFMSRRPMTYQLIGSIMKSFALSLEEVRIDRFEEGVFYATLVVSDGFNKQEVDARVSDAVALAMHLSVNITMADSVLREVGFTPQDDDEPMGESVSAADSVEDLEEELRRCEENEEYERAEEIMKKIRLLKGER